MNLETRITNGTGNLTSMILTARRKIEVPVVKRIFFFFLYSTKAVMKMSLKLRRSFENVGNNVIQCNFVIYFVLVH